MKIIVRWIIVLVVAFAAVPAVAGQVGFLDTERAIKTVEEGKRQMQALDVWANERADELELMRGNVAEMNEHLNAQRTIATDEVVKKLENDLLQAQRELEDAARVLRSDFDAKQRAVLPGGDPGPQRGRRVCRGQRV
jgi:Skp family chaperone for outer membrane proteins